MTKSCILTQSLDSARHSRTEVGRKGISARKMVPGAQKFIPCIREWELIGSTGPNEEKQNPLMKSETDIPKADSATETIR